MYIHSIDGLRAIAVMIVVLFHAGVTSFQGGFIGVDVFFVISGFLITNNIVTQMEADKFTFSGFYKKRAARLLPALFVVIFFTIIASYFFLPIADLQSFSSSSIFAVVSLSNIFFWSEAGYFEKASELKPLLHTWSLSVEEQFYLIWPSFLVFVLTKSKRFGLAIAVTVISLISLCAATLHEKVFAEAVFFLTPYRMYQFGIGAFLAIVGVSQPRWEQAFIATCGIVGLAFLTVYVSESSSVWLTAVAPAMCAGAFIIGSRYWLISKVFTIGPLVWLGRRSYSIYLVHWPVMVLWKLNTDFEFTGFEQFTSVLVCLLLGGVLYTLVEQRYRFSASVPKSFHRRILVTIVLFGCLNICLSIYGAYRLERHGVSDQDLMAVANTSGGWGKRSSLIRDGKCNINPARFAVSDYDKSECLMIVEGSSNWLVVGDSFASGTYALFASSFPDVNFLQMTIPGCPFKPAGSPHKKQICSDLYETVFSFIQSEGRLDGVIIAGNWGNDAIQNLTKLIEFVEKAGKKTILVGPRLTFKLPIPSIVTSSSTLTGATEKANALIESSKISHKLNESILVAFSDRTLVVNMIDLQCSDSGCPIFDENNNILYLDASHFSSEGIDWMRQRLLRTYIDSLKLRL